LLQVLDAAPGAVQVSAVTLVVQALRDEKGTAKAFDEVAAFPHWSGPIVWLLIGGDEARIDRLDRDRTVMTIPLEQPLEQIWSAPVDVVTGELVAVRPA
ncbi:MAG: hypothetical protein ACRDZ5_07275, partial [Acidimicrobiales bacterium]